MLTTRLMDYLIGVIILFLEQMAMENVTLIKSTELASSNLMQLRIIFQAQDLTDLLQTSVNMMEMYTV